MADITTGLTNYWKFDGNLGASVGGDDFTGTATYEAGIIGQRAILPTLSQIAVSNNTTADVALGSFTVSFWYRAETYSQQFLAWKKQGLDATSPGWLLFANPNGSVNSMVVDDGNRRAFLLSAAGALASATDAHVCSVFDRDGQTFVLYINGAVVDNTPSFDGTGAPTALSEIDTLTNTQTLKFKGSGLSGVSKVDDLRFYNRALSAADVTQLYEFRGGGGTAATILANRRSRGC